MRNKKRHLLCKFLLILFSGIAPYAAFAQTIKWSASQDSSTIRIGEQTVIRLKLQSDGKQKLKNITWPVLRDSIMKGVQIVRVSKIDTLRADSGLKNQGLTQVQRITITSFDSGYYAIPPFRLIVDGDSSKALLTDPLLLNVQGMRVDTTLAIKDIKQPLEEPFDWHEVIPWIKWVAAGLALLIAAVLLVRYFRKKPALLKREVKAIPAHIVALENLEKLREKKLWQNNKLKPYHSELTDILRLYIEQRFGINALEQTSDEIMTSFKSVAVGMESKARLSQIFRLADLVKFAKQHALPNENEMSLDNAFAFVQETKPNQNGANHEATTLS